MDILWRNALIELVGFIFLVGTLAFIVFFLMRGRALIFKWYEEDEAIDQYNQEKSDSGKLHVPKKKLSLFEKCVRDRWKVFLMAMTVIGFITFWNTMMYGFVRLNATTEVNDGPVDIVEERINSEPLTVEAIERSRPTSLEKAQEDLEETKTKTREKVTDSLEKDE